VQIGRSVTLEQKGVAPYLLQRGLLSPEAIVDGHLTVRDASSRNRDFKVECMRGPSLLVKQGVGPEGMAAVEHEAAVYGVLSQIGELEQYVPRLFSYDPGRHVLVLELVGQGEDLRKYHVRQGRFSLSLARSLGRALGTLHRLTRQTAEATIHKQPPFVLSLHRPDSSIFRHLSGPSIELIKIVQQTPGFGARLDEIRACWKYEALAHHDLKWDNVIVLPAPGSNRLSRVKLIDWEAAGPGDPSWDIGSIFSQYLSFWLFSIPVTGDVPPERFPELARFPLDKMWPAIARFWRAYTSERRLDPRSTDELLLRTVSSTGARLVQTALEVTQGAMQMTSNVVLHLQLSQNILERPLEASAHLLGLSLGG
jgi:aminoglycoside phosphotransferase (APT) family kinase protein